MARVFVGNLPAGVREDELESTFDKFGRTRAVAIKFPQRPPPFAFIEYEDERDASDAVRSMHGREFQGSRLRVEISHSGAHESSSLDNRLRGTQYRVRVTNLPPSASWQDLKDFLRHGGDVAHADVDRRGNGVASFATHDDMERAIEKLDRTELMGERVRIREERDEASTDEPPRAASRERSPVTTRRQSPSRSRSRSRSSYSRSRSRSPVRRSRSHRGRSYSRSRSRSYSPRRWSSRRRSRSRSRSR